MRAVPDFPGNAESAWGDAAMILVPAFAAFGALWRPPARWALVVVPVVVLAGAYELARFALASPHLFLGFPPVAKDFTFQFALLAGFSAPGALVGAAVASAAFPD